MVRPIVTCLVFVTIACPAPSGAAAGAQVSSLKELAGYAARSGNNVTMKPGLYRLTDFLPIDSMAARRERKEFQFMTFSGSNNVFNLDGVTIEVNTALRTALKPPIHTSEFLITGDKNVFKGLSIRCVGQGTSPGGALLELAGTGNTLRDCAFWVQGSYPYGYGDLFGKGGGNVIKHQKHSGVRIVGSNSSLYGCKLFQRAFGHGYYIQGGDNHLFEDCYVEGAVRSTDHMLAETSGPAFDVGFRSVYKNRQGENKVTPGYMKSLSEDGFRTYSQAKNLVLKNCTAKNMRGGFELRTKEGARLENCTAIGNERGFWVSTDATVIHCKGDAQYGPLLFVEGDNASVEIELLPTESEMTVHGLATIHGLGHKVTIRPTDNRNRIRPVPILVGYAQPSAGEGMSPYGQRPSRKITLRNETTMPVVIGERAEGAEIVTHGPVQENAGKNSKIDEL